MCSYDKKYFMKTNIDSQVANYKDYLINNVRLSESQSIQVGTLVEKELENLSKTVIEQLVADNPVPIQARHDELFRFQLMMDFINESLASEKNLSPGLIGAQIVVQNYISFVYMQDNLFKILNKSIDSSSLVSKITEFLLTDKIRHFRNAISHGTWCYAEDYKGIKYWDWKDRKPNNGYDEYFVEHDELGFWQTLSRGFSYVVIEKLIEFKKELYK